MKFEEWFNNYGKNTEYEFKVFPASRIGLCNDSWVACKTEVLKIIEDEIDNGTMSIAVAAKKIREL